MLVGNMPAQGADGCGMTLAASLAFPVLLWHRCMLSESLHAWSPDACAVLSQAGQLQGGWSEGRTAREP